MTELNLPEDWKDNPLDEALGILLAAAITAVDDDFNYTDVSSPACATLDGTDYNLRNIGMAMVGPLIELLKSNRSFRKEFGLP
jgi:hypothetical protein